MAGEYGEETDHSGPEVHNSRYDGAKALCQYEAEVVYVIALPLPLGTSPWIPPLTFAINLNSSVSKLMANTIETGKSSIAIGFRLIHRGWGGWRRLMLRGSAASREP